MEIINFVCKELTILDDDFYSKKRHFEFTRARAICATILRSMQYRYVDVAKFINKDREMIYYYEKIHKSLMCSDKKYRDTYNNILQKLKDNMIIE